MHLLPIIAALLLAVSQESLAKEEDKKDNSAVNQFFAGLAKQLIGAVFPDLANNDAQNLPAQKEVVSEPNPGPPQAYPPGVPVAIPGYHYPQPGQNNFPENLRFAGYPDLAPPNIYENSPNLYQRAPQFPAHQSLFPAQTGLSGRTDLPASWVYPFAPQGTVIAPDNFNNQTFALRAGQAAGYRLEANQQAALQQALQRIQQDVATQQQIQGLVQESHAKPYEISLSPVPQRIRLNSDSNDNLPTIQKELKKAALSKKNPDSQPISLSHPKAQKLNRRYKSKSTRVLEPQKNFTRLSLSSNAIRGPQSPLGIRPNFRKSSSNPCQKCLPLDLTKVSGSWTQIYGSPNELRNVYSTIRSLLSLNQSESVLTTDLRPIQPSCVGLQVSQPQLFMNEISAANLFFRDDTNDRKLHELFGVVKKDQSQFQLKMKLLNLPMCLLKAGFSAKNQYSYIVIARTSGQNQCQSFHVFARDAEQFFDSHNSEVVHYLKQEVEKGAVPLSVLPFPELCQLRE